MQMSSGYLLAAGLEGANSMIFVKGENESGTVSLK